MRSTDVTDEGNVLIAEFLGWVKESRDYSPVMWQIPSQFIKGYGDSSFAKHDNGLEFHYQWSWLMPVVEKIESVSVETTTWTSLNPRAKVTLCFTVEISGNQCLIHNSPSPQYYGTEEDFLKLYDCRNTSKEEAVYRAVVKFIKWYNRKTKKSHAKLS